MICHCINLGLVALGRIDAVRVGSGFKKVENATAVIWKKRLLLAEKTFRRLDAPELLTDLASGVVDVNGVRAVNRRGEKADR